MDNNILGAFVVFYAVIVIVLVIMYVITSVSFVKCLKGVGYSKPWLAWLPFANYYALADALTTEEAEILPKIKLSKGVFKFWWVLFIVISLIPFIGGILGIIFMTACLGYNFWKLYEQLFGGDQKVIGYISAFIPIIAVVRFLSVKPGSAVAECDEDGKPVKQSKSSKTEKRRKDNKGKVTKPSKKSSGNRVKKEDRNEQYDQTHGYGGELYVDDEEEPVESRPVVSLAKSEHSDPTVNEEEVNTSIQRPNRESELWAMAWQRMTPQQRQTYEQMDEFRRRAWKGQILKALYNYDLQ